MKTFTPREQVDFLIEEVLNPFTDSSLFDDYQETYEGDHDEFEERFWAGMEILAAAPDMYEALMQASFAIPTTHGAFETVRAALAKAKGQQP